MFHPSQTTILCDPYCTLPMWQTHARRPCDQAVPRVSTLYGVLKIREFPTRKSTFIGYKTDCNATCQISGPRAFIRRINTDKKERRKRKRKKSIQFIFVSSCLWLYLTETTNDVTLYEYNL